MDCGGTASALPTTFPTHRIKSQRDFASKPRVGARNERLPWVIGNYLATPTGLRLFPEAGPKKTQGHARADNGGVKLHPHSIATALRL